MPALLPDPQPRVSRRTVLFAVAGLTVLGAGVAKADAGLSAATGGTTSGSTAAGSGLPNPLLSALGRPATAQVAVSRGPAAAQAAGAHVVTAPLTVRDPRSGRPLHPGVESYVSGATRELVLSIDDGPSVPYTGEILALLRRYQVQATFCMVGRNVATYPEVAKSVAAEGHQLANHTWSHAWLPDLSHAAMVREIDRAEEVLDKVTDGAAPTVFRAPFGAWSTAIIDVCWQRRMRALGWSIDPRDWARPPARQIVSNVLHNAAPGRIVLDHDGGGDRSHTVEAMKVYLPRLLHLGYHFVLP
jgi:peptidoglycan/xylan/chitin deacetylase (PgdA/CDA1 family)